MSAFTFLASKRMNREHYAHLALLTLAASGDDKAIKGQYERWEKES